MVFRSVTLLLFTALDNKFVITVCTWVCGFVRCLHSTLRCAQHRLPLMGSGTSGARLETPSSKRCRRCRIPAAAAAATPPPPTGIGAPPRA
eukprot:607091-Amphidinium_carterae.1